MGVCVRQIQIEEFVDSELCYGHVSKYTTRGSNRFREKFIVKLSFYHSEFVALKIV